MSFFVCRRAALQSSFRRGRLQVPLNKSFNFRTFATELRRPLPATELPRPPPPTEPPHITSISETSKPRPYYARHGPNRQLPRIKSRWPAILAFSIVGILGWGAFYMYVTNEEKVTSSVVKGILRCVRSDPQLKESLGEAIRPQPEWWLNGDPLIRGRVSTLSGFIDVSFRIRGSKDSGTLYFTSVRKEKGVPFTIVRFKVIADDGTVVTVDSENM